MLNRQFLFLAGVWTTFATACNVGAAVVAVSPLPPIPAQCGGEPPVPLLVFDRHIDFGNRRPRAGIVGRIDVRRSGDFNNPTAAVDPNGAPEEGIAIFGIDQHRPNTFFPWVTWAGIEGTPNTCDETLNRQELRDVPFNQDDLLQTMVGNQALIRVVIGRSADQAGLVDIVFHVDVRGRRVPGDTNGDDIVDHTDLNNVRNEFGARGNAILVDANEDGVVDLLDLNDVRNYFGTSAVPPNPVPEPTAIQLSGACIAAMATWLRRCARARRSHHRAQ